MLPGRGVAPSTVLQLQCRRRALGRPGRRGPERHLPAKTQIQHDRPGWLTLSNPAHCLTGWDMTQCPFHASYNQSGNSLHIRV